MAHSEHCFVHAGKYGKTVNSVPAGENLKTAEVKPACNHKFDVYKAPC